MRIVRNAHVDLFDYNSRLNRDPIPIDFALLTMIEARTPSNVPRFERSHRVTNAQVVERLTIYDVRPYIVSLDAI